MAAGWIDGAVPVKGSSVTYSRRPGGPTQFVWVPGTWGHDYDPGWRYLAGRLPGDWDLVVISLRGRGRSGPVPRNGSIEMYSLDVLNVCDAAGLNNYVVAGHSMGGMIAVQIAGLQPAALRGAISVEGWSDATVVDSAFGGDVHMPRVDRNQLVAEQQRLRHGHGWTPQMEERERWIWHEWNGYDSLSRCRCQVLQLWGDRGRATPSLADLQVPDRANVSVRWISGADHDLLTSHPNAVAAEVRRFVDGLEDVY